MPTVKDINNAVLKNLCEADPLFFTQHFFKAKEGINFISNWHHRLIADTLLDVERGKYNGHVVIINVSPGSSKTQMTVVNWIPRCLAINPRCRFLHLSYSDQLAEQNSLGAKDIILMDEFQELWDLSIRSDSKSKKRWNVTYKDDASNKNAGGIYATSMRGQITGFRAGHMSEGFQGAIIIDDPLSPEMAESTADRNKINEILVNTIKSRKATPDTPIVLIMQRLHENDPTGFIRNGGLNLPIKQIKIPAIVENEEGKEESYWEYKEPIASLLKERENSSIRQKYVFYGQYMQEPAPVGNGEFKREHIQRYDVNTKNFDCTAMNIWILYDPANTKKKHSDYTAMVVVGLHNDNNMYLLDVIRDKLNPTERINKLISLHKKWAAKGKKPPKVAIEQYGMMTDAHYLKEAQKDMNYRFSHVEVGGRLSKEDRIRRLLPEWESNRIYIPDSILYRNTDDEIVDLTACFIDDELLMFPVGKNDDMIDAMTRIYDVNAVYPKIHTEYYSAGSSRPMSDVQVEDFMSW